VKVVGDLQVTSTEPVDKAISVDLNTTVSFQFAVSLDSTAVYSRGLPVEFFAVSPPDSIVIERAYYSQNYTTLNLDVRHSAATDFLWILTGARSAAGTDLCYPFVLSYSTAPDRGPWTVAGEARAFVEVKRQDCDVFELIPVLFNRPPAKRGYPVAAAVVDTQGGTEWIVSGVRNGTYWPAVLADIDRDGIIEPGAWPLQEWAYYDPDGDRRADSITVADGDETGVVLDILVGLSRDDARVTRASSLVSVYPNPAHLLATIVLETDAPGPTRLDLMDVLGRRVRTLADGYFYPGRHTIPLDASSLPAGVYFIRLRTGDRVDTRSLVVVR
jgi:hypothetical protein